MADKSADRSRIFVIGVEMENRSAEEIAKDAANLIGAIFDRLVAEQRAREKADLKKENEL